MPERVPLTTLHLPPSLVETDESLPRGAQSLEFPHPLLGVAVFHDSNLWGVNAIPVSSIEKAKMQSAQPRKPVTGMRGLAAGRRHRSHT